MRKLYISYLVLIGMFCHSLSVVAGEILSIEMPFSHELISNEVRDIYQDDAGYLWVATSKGLARYDGYRIQTFRNDYRFPNRLTNDCIIEIGENEQYIWIGTQKGLNLLDKHTYKIYPSPDEELSERSIEYILRTKDNQMWVASGTSVYRCSADGRILRTYAMTDIVNPGRYFTVNSVYQDGEGTIWCMLGWGGICRYDVEQDAFIPLHNAPTLDYHTMYQDRNRRYWLGTWGNGLWEYLPKEDGEECFRYQPVTGQKEAGNDAVIYSIVQDDELQYLWLLSYGGLYVLDVSTSSVAPVNIEDKVDIHKMYTRIVKDKEGNLWISSYDLGRLICFDRSGIKNILLSQIKEDIGLAANILNLCMDEENRMWIHQDRWGICLYDAERDRLTCPVIRENYIYPGQMAKSHTRNAVWISDSNNPHLLKLVRQDDKLITLHNVNLNALLDNPGKVVLLSEDGNGRLWVLTERALAVISPAYEVLVAEKREKVRISSLATDKRTGQVWAVSDSNMVMRLDIDKGILVDQRLETFISCPDESVLLSCIDYNGCLWIASSLNRIYKSDMEKKNFRLLPFEGIMDDCTLLKLLADEHYLWIMTNKKVMKYNMATNTYINYGTTDSNIEIDLFRGQAACLDGNGGIYVGGHNGLLHIREQLSRMLPSPMSPVVTDVRVNGKSIFFDDVRMVDDDNTTDCISLNPSDRNMELCLSTLCYGLQERPRIAVKMEGLDRDWVYLPPKQLSAYYNRLPAGNYTFLLKYADSNGEWTECSRILTIIQQPAWYETWYAYALYIVLSLLLLWWLMAYGIPLFKKFQAVRKVNITMAHRHIVDFLHIMSARYPQKGEANEEESGDKKLVSRVTGIIEAHLGENEFDLDSCAKELGMSKSTLYRRIKNATGLTPFELIRNIKMKKACLLLDRGELSISEIAYALGFSNPKYFTKCFKEELGMTPTEFMQRTSAKG